MLSFPGCLIVVMFSGESVRVFCWNLAINLQATWAPGLKGPSITGGIVEDGRWLGLGPLPGERRGGWLWMVTDGTSPVSWDLVTSSNHISIYLDISRYISIMYPFLVRKGSTHRIFADGAGIPMMFKPSTASWASSCLPGPKVFS